LGKEKASGKAKHEKYKIPFSSGAALLI